MLKLYLQRKMINCFKRPFTCLSSSDLSSSSLSSISSSQRDYMSKLTSRILDSKTPGQALCFFKSISAKIDVTKNRQPHSAIINVLTKAKWYLEARCLLKCLIQNLLKTCTPPRVCSIVYKDLNRVDASKFTNNVFGVLIITLSEMGLVDEAIWVYCKVKELPAIQACNALLKGLVKAGRFSSMWDFYNNMVSRGMAPTVVTYGTLLDACCDEGEIEKARDLLGEMVGKGIEPTVVIFTTLIHGLCNENRLSEAEDLFRTMTSSGVVPNLYTYNALMDGYCKVANLRRAIRLYREMLSHNLEPNVVTFGILVDALCKVGEFDIARSLFPLW